MSTNIVPQAAKAGHPLATPALLCYDTSCKQNMAEYGAMLHSQQKSTQAESFRWIPSLGMG